MLLEPLAEEVGKDLDPFDLICHVAFDQPPLTRRERADNVRKRDVFTKYGPQARAVLEALLESTRTKASSTSTTRGSCRSRRSTRWARRRSSIKQFGDARRLRARRPRTAGRALPGSRLTAMSVRNTVKSIQDIMRQDAGVDGDAQRISQLCWMFFLKIIDDQDQELELMQHGYRSPIPSDLHWRTWAADPEGITGDDAARLRQRRAVPGLKELPVAGSAAATAAASSASVFEDAYNYMKSGQLMRQVINKINEVDFNNLAERQHFGDIYEQILNDLQSAGNAGEYYTPRAVTAFMVDRIDPKPGEILLDPACGTGGFLTCAIRHMRERYVKTVEDERAHAAGAAGRGEEAAAAHALRHQHAAARHRGPELRPPRQHAGPALHQLRARRPRRHRPHQPALRRHGRRRHRDQLPASTSRPARPPTCSWR